MSRAGSTTRDRSRGRPTAAPRRPVAARGRPSSRTLRRRRALAATAGLLVLALAGWLLWFGPVLAVRTVQVDGVGPGLAERVTAAAGIRPGTPLLRVDVDATADRVGTLPRVADVEVARGWPDRVVLTVTERLPVAVIDEAGRRRLLAADGVSFDVEGQIPDGVVPLDVPTPGPDDAATSAALAAVAALDADVRARVERASGPGPEDITLTLTDGTSVTWGGPAHAATKAAVLSALLDQIAAGDVEPAGVIDVSAPDAVVLR